MGNKKGVFLVFSAALLFSIGGLLVKIIPWSAMALNGSRCLISVIVLSIYMKLTNNSFVINRTVILGSICTFGTNVLYAFANKLTTAANTIVLEFTAPVFIIIFMWLIFREKPKKADIYTCCAVFFGIVLVFCDSMSSGNGLGNILALASGATYAGVFMLNSFEGGSPISSVLLGHILSAVIGLPFLTAETDFSGSVLICVAVMGLFQVALAYICLTEGLKTTPPVTASLVSGIEPVMNPILVAVFYKEYISFSAIIGCVIVIGSVLVYDVMRSRGENDKKDEI